MEILALEIIKSTAKTLLALKMLKFPVIMSAAFAGLFLWTIKINAKKWIFLLLGLLPLAFVFLWTPRTRIVSAHAFWHTSIVYQIMNGNIPPDNPLLAGEPLLYPWATHLLIAGISYGLHTSPPTAFALMNLCALLITMSLVFKISKFFSTDWIANVFAVFLSIFGLTFLSAFPNIFPYPTPPLPIPVFSKFGQVNSTHLGILFFALFLYSILHIFSAITLVKRYYATLVISVVGAGLFYPFHWIGVLACCFFCCLILYLLHGRKVFLKTIAVLGCVVGSALVVLPYLYQISQGKGEAASLTLASPLHVFRYSFIYLCSVLPISIILFWKRSILLDVLRTKADFAIILSTSITTTALMYVFLSGPLGVEYKYAMLSYLSLGILGSICFSDIYLRNRVICYLLVTSFLVPFSAYTFKKLRPHKADPIYIIEDGLYLHHREPEKDNLHKWISSQTKHDAVFVDSKLPTIALFGRRQVYFGQPDEMVLGWYQPFEFLGYSPEMTGRRKQVVDEIYSDSETELSAHVLETLNSTTSGVDVYVITRDAASNKKLVNDEHFEKVFESGMTTIYKLLKSTVVLYHR